MASGYLFNKHTCWREISSIAKEGKTGHSCTALHQSSRTGMKLLGALQGAHQCWQLLGMHSVKDQQWQFSTFFLLVLVGKSIPTAAWAAVLPAAAISQLKLWAVGSYVSPCSTSQVKLSIPKICFTSTHSLKHPLYTLPIKMVVLNIFTDC